MSDDNQPMDEPEYIPVKYTEHYILIDGKAYELSTYGEPYEDGSRQATLREVAPF